MKSFYGISITHSLCSKHIVCQKNKIGWGGGEESQLSRAGKGRHN
jgi:hypothetical protein